MCVGGPNSSGRVRRDSWIGYVHCDTNSSEPNTRRRWICRGQRRCTSRYFHKMENRGSGVIICHKHSLL